MRWLALLLLLTACSDNTTFTPVPSSTQFTSFYGRGLTYCDDFDFGEPHYCVKQIPARIGQVATITFTFSGNVHPVDASMNPVGTPARLRLFVWRQADNMTCAGAYKGYRQWSTSSIELAPGKHTLSAQLVPENFTDCYGQHNGEGLLGALGHAGDAGSLQNLFGIGFTFGGNDGGHGVAGQGHFHLDSFTVQ